MSKIVVAREDGAVFYRENNQSNHPYEHLGVIDWQLLAKQKLALLKSIWNEREHVLWGLVALIDAIQDDAEEKGYPVIWFSPEEEFEEEDSSSTDG